MKIIVPQRVVDVPEGDGCGGCDALIDVGQDDYFYCYYRCASFNRELKTECNSEAFKCDECLNAQRELPF